jgi:uncharacterized protein (TIGR00288 family)
MQADSERALAIFVDFDNIAQGFRRSDRFDIQRVLKRMVEKGKIVAKKTYADWSRYGQYTALLHEAAFELVEIPKRSQTGKNSADIRLCVDAMDLAYQKPHIDTFVIVSGDSDFTPLVSKLKEMGKHVIGLGMQGSTSDLLRDNCDEFIYYEDLDVEKSEVPRVDLPVPETKRKALELLLEACVALRRENKEKLWASMIKETMKRKKPSFNETYHGFRTFSALLEDAQAQGLVELERDEQRGTYVVVRFGDETKGAPARRSVPMKGRGRSRGEEGFHPREPVARKEPAAEPRRDILEPKTRTPSFQGFADFERESAEFSRPASVRSENEEFPGFRGAVRPIVEATSAEVMAKMTNEPRTPAAPPAEPVIEEPAAEEEPKGDKHRKRRRRGKGKGREEAETPAPEEATEVVAPPEEEKAALEPISFEDVPFQTKVSEPAEAAAPVAFDEHSPPAAIREDTGPRRSRHQKEPAHKKDETQPAAPVEPAKLSAGFGFGIFDE